MVAESAENLIHRLTSLERTVGTLNSALNDTTTSLQQVQEQAAETIVPGQTNLLPNGDFDFSRNLFLYETDFSDMDGSTVDADVSEEAYNWFVAEPDTAVESTGSISATDKTLTLDTPDFIADDEDVEIVVEGAGASGADLVTTIDVFTDSTHVELTDAAVTTVTNARVRWRLRALVEDSTDEDADSDETTNTALKTESHSRFEDVGIINDPFYDKTNGWARISSTNWLVAPMPKNYFKASTTYFITFIYRLSEEESYPVTPFVGLWDNSLRQFLEGQPIEVAGETEGTPTATISREYFIVFYTNWGKKIGSQKVTVADAPAAGSFVTNSVYVQLSWTQPRGVIRTEIYRKTGSEYKLIGLPVQGQFKDNNAAGRQAPYSDVAGYPEVDYTRARAFNQATASNFPPTRSDTWQFASFAVNVPYDYDASENTDKQWFVLGLPEEMTEGMLEIDKVSVDDKFGLYSVCSLDLTAKRGLASAPTSGSQGNPGGEPVDVIGCPTFEMPIDVEIDGRRRTVCAIDLVNNEDKYLIINRRNEPVRYKAEVSKTKQVIYEARCSNYKTLRASKDHPCFEDEQDVVGKSLQYLTLNDTILTKDGTAKVLSNVRQVKKEFTVKLTLLDDPERGFWVNGFGGHNLKDPF